jgi:hypothetical protein
MVSMMYGLFLMACSGGGVQGIINVDTGSSVDSTGPQIEHTPVTDPHTYKMSVSFDAVVNDESGVLFVELMYKQETAAEWRSVLMSEVGGGLYQGTIPGDSVYDASISYYIVAQDTLENEACLPSDCALVPWSFPVVN